MNRFNLQIHYAAVVSFVFVIAYTSADGGSKIEEVTERDVADEQHFVQLLDQRGYKIIFPEDIDDNGYIRMRMKRGFFWSNDDDDKDCKKDTTTKSTITTAVNAVDGAVTTATTKVTTTAVTGAKMAATTGDVGSTADEDQSDELNVVCIAGNVEKSLAKASPYLPLVKKLVDHIVPGISRYDTVTMSVNVAELTKRGYEDYAGAKTVSAKIASKTIAEAVPQTESDAGSSFSYFATGIFGKLKNAYESHFGPVPKLFEDGESTESPAQADSLFDKVKSKINVVHNYLNGYDAPDTETNKNKIETTVTKAYIEGSQSPNTDMIETKTYESGAETLHQATNGGTNLVNITTELIENGKSVGKKITKKKNSSESLDSSADENIEAYDDDNEDENTLCDDELEIKEEDFNKAMEEYKDQQPDFIEKLSGEELLKHIDELQKPLPNLDIESRKVFIAVSDTLYFEDDVSEDQVNELVNALVKATNYFISTAIENGGIIKTKPMN